MDFSILAGIAGGAIGYLFLSNRRGGIIKNDEQQSYIEIYPDENYEPDYDYEDLCLTKTYRLRGIIHRVGTDKSTDIFLDEYDGVVVLFEYTEDPIKSKRVACEMRLPNAKNEKFFVVINASKDLMDLVQNFILTTKNRDFKDGLPALKFYVVHYKNPKHKPANPYSYERIIGSLGSIEIEIHTNNMINQIKDRIEEHKKNPQETDNDKLEKYERLFNQCKR